MSTTYMKQYKRLILIFGDIALFYGALLLALIERGREVVTVSVWADHWPAFTLVLGIWLIVFYINDLYSSRGTHRGPAIINRLLTSMLVNVALAAIFFYLTSRLWSIKPQTILLLTSVNALILIYLWRLIIAKILGAETMKDTILFIGYNEVTQELIETIEHEPQLGYTINAIVDGVANNDSDIPWYELSEKTIQSVLFNHRIDTVVVSSEQFANPAVITALYRSITPNVSVMTLHSFYEELTGKIPLHQIGQAWALENLTTGKDRLFLFTKRVIDIVLFIGVGIIAIILMPLTALALFIEQPKSHVIFSQQRVGQYGKKYYHLKFRSMTEINEPSGKAEWSSKNNSRVTRVGKFIRKTRIDELPQLFNVLKGEMSFVGPRPERPEFVEELMEEIPFYKERLLVKPGLTGWAQVEGPAYGGSKEGSLEKLQYDLFYIKNRSLGIEFSVILKTIKTILLKKGQ